MLSPVVTHPLLDVAVDDFRSPVKADLRSIDGQLIVAAVAPLLLAVEVMVQLAALVIFLDHHFRVLIGNMEFRRHALDLFRHIAGHKDADDPPVAL